MTSKTLQVVNDTPGHFASVHGNAFLDMPSGDTTGENSHWLPNVYDAVGDNIQVQFKNCGGGEHLNTSQPDSRFTSFSNKDKLFSSFTPNTLEDKRFSFSAGFSDVSNGNKWILLGSPYKSQLLTSKARWTCSLGVQFTLKSYSNFKTTSFDKLHLIYYKPSEESMCYATVTDNTVEIVDDNHKRFYGYVSREDSSMILSEKMIAVGAVMEFYTRGNGSIDLYDFKLLRSRENRTDRSLLIVPSPHLIKSRQQMQSVPIA